MSDFLTAFLASILAEEGATDPQGIAERAAADLRKARMVDPMAVKRAAILADPCRDYKIVRRRYEVSTGFVYNVWSERLSTHKE